MELKELVGLHWLSGVERWRREVQHGHKTVYHEGIRFCIDGETYVAEGITYGCSGGKMTSFGASPESCCDETFPPVQVLGTMSCDMIGKMLFFLDTANGQPLLVIGEDPWANLAFTARFEPDLCATDLRVLDQDGTLHYPGEWQILKKRYESANGDAHILGYDAYTDSGLPGFIRVRIFTDTGCCTARLTTESWDYIRRSDGVPEFCQQVVLQRGNSPEFARKNLGRWQCGIDLAEGRDFTPTEE